MLIIIFMKKDYLQKRLMKLKDFMKNIFDDMEMQISFKSLDKGKNICFENRSGETFY